MVLRIEGYDICIIGVDVGYLVCDIVEGQIVENSVDYRRNLNDAILVLKKKVGHQADNSNVTIGSIRDLEGKEVEHICNLSELSYNLVGIRVVEINRQKRAQLEENVRIMLGEDDE